MPEVKDHVLKISGKMSIFEPVLMGHNYKLEIDSTITSITESDNNDGTVMRYYKCEPITAIVKKDNGEVVKAKDTRSMSQLLRARLWKYWSSKANTTQEFDDWYQALMLNIIQRAEDIAEMYEPSK
jgi:hypothetical protein